MTLNVDLANDFTKSPEASSARDCTDRTLPTRSLFSDAGEFIAVKVEVRFYKIFREQWSKPIDYMKLGIILESIE